MKALVGLIAFSAVITSTSAIELVGPKHQKKIVATATPVYGPITNSDTLWRIALNARKDPSLSVDQVMIAIFMANPNAFVDNNINLLKNGAVLKIPSVTDIKAITVNQAKNKVAQDSQLLPAAKSKLEQQPTPTTKTSSPSQTTQADAAPIEVDDSAQTDVTNTDTPAHSKQLQSAMADMQLLMDENSALRSQIDQLTVKLESMQAQEAIDLQAHKELETLTQELQQIESEKMNESSSIMNNGWFIAAISSIPALLGLGGLFYFLARRFKGQPEEEVQATEVVAVEADLSLEDDTLSEDLLDDELLISDDDDELASLDDLDDDLLAPSLDDELLVPDDELDSIQLDIDDDELTDDLPLDDSTIISEDDIDALLMQADEEAADNDDIVSSDDIDALLASAEADEAEAAPVDADDIDALLASAGDTAVDADDIDALLASTEAAPVDADDIDALLASAEAAPVDADDIDALLASAEAAPVDADDIDALLASAEAAPVDADDIDALLASAEAAPVDADDIDALLASAEAAPVDADDIDALLASTEAAPVDADDIDALLASTEEAPVDADDIDALLASTEEAPVDADDIDALLASAEAAPVDADDIDALLASTEEAPVDADDIDALLASTEAAPVDADDIDALLASTEAAPVDDQQEESSDSLDIDDIDALLDETDVDNLPDGASEAVDIDDIDALLSETEVDETEVDDASEAVDIEDIDALLSETDVDETEVDDASEAVDIEDIDALLSETDVDETDVDASEVVDGVQESNDISPDDIEGLLANNDFDDTESLPLELDDEALPDKDTADADPFNDDELEALLGAETGVQESPDTQKATQSEAEQPSIYEANVVEQPYLMTTDHDPMSSEAAQHLVDALDGMLAPQTQGETTSNDNLDELDDILANENIATQAPALEQAADDIELESSEIELNEQLEKFEQENSFIDIDKLLNDSALSDDGAEPYKDVDLDTGLSEFPEILPTGAPVDVDDDPNNSSKKLDLARAYLEIDDQDSAQEILEFVSDNGDAKQQKEAKRLLTKIKN